MQKLSLARAKQIKALHQKKIREETNLFLVEGLKPVLELMSSDWKIETIVASDSFYGDYQKNLLEFGNKVFVCSADELSQISTFKTNTKVLAVVSQKQVSAFGPDQMADFWLVLEAISDPGNLGTIIRLADWFGLKEVITIGEGVEWYNPKVIAASMGSFLRIKQLKSDAQSLLAFNRLPFVADLNGENLYDFSFPEKSMLVIGNEAKGPTEFWEKNKIKKLSIPAFGYAESLNAGIATGIFLNHYRFLKR
jgi:TrmH family RNA methyltransferase